MPGDGELTTDDIDTLIAQSPATYEPRATSTDEPLIAVAKRRMVKLGSVDQESASGAERKEGLLSSVDGQAGAQGQGDSVDVANSNPLASDSQRSTESSDDT